MKIQSFTDLNAWREGHQLVLEIYKVTKLFPIEERYGLIDQMRRSAVSITSNTAEGFSRKTKKEKAQFFYMTLGSITELQNQLLIARDIGYLSRDKFQNIAEKTVTVSKLINGLIKSSKAFII
ncbi:MAG: S23 ribosomal protein [Microgenomates group bacterium Gr01-1014_7]|nr:MAG: S23 ribosomal protein [Microgenomates group bacterium Gr01-1014_7]